MRINWFSPLPPARTDIAHYTERTVRALSQVVEVAVWTEQKKWDRAIEEYAEVRRYSPDEVPWREVQRADATFYNIGNNAEFHLGICQASRLHPGIVVLHDARLQHFFAYCYRWLWGDKDGYVSVMERYYGAAGRRDAELFWGDSLSVGYMVERYPLTPLALENALAALVHTPQGYDLAVKQKWCPVTYAPLPYPARSWHSADSGRDGERGKSQPYRLIVFGYLHHNRRLEAILEALALLPEKNWFHLDIYGQVWNTGLIHSLIESHGLRENVTVHGFVPEAELDAALEAADLAFNLRYPTVGEASGSQLRIWDHSLPALVTRAGWYATVPEDAVVFVSMEHEIEDIHGHLRAFLAEPQRFAEMGRRGRRLLQSYHSPASYARFIERIAVEAPGLRCRGAAFYLADRVADEMSQWITPMAMDVLIESVSRQISTLTKPIVEPPGQFPAPEELRESLLVGDMRVAACA
jgi:glycosyltransferase involved in cell wall biosynthesis